MTIFARKSDSFCSQTTSPAALPQDSGTGGGQQVTLVASVGNRGTNRDDDTRKIQRALNEVPEDAKVQRCFHSLIRQGTQYSALCFFACRRILEHVRPSTLVL